MEENKGGKDAGSGGKALLTSNLRRRSNIRTVYFNGKKNGEIV